MIIKFNDKKLYELIESFYRLTGIKVAIYDCNFKEVLACPVQNSPFCRLIQKNKVSCRECIESTVKLCEKCSLKQTVIIEKCTAGLTEVIAPLSDGVSVIGYIMFGQITNERDRDVFLNEIFKRCEKYKLDKLKLKESAEKIPYYSDKQLEDASKILNALSVYIVYEKLVYSGELSVAHEMVKYIRENLEKDLSVCAICKKFYLSKSEVYKITKPYMPNGIAAFVRKERIKKACDLLIHTDLPAWKIAEQTGFSDVDYFLRVFKAEMGIPTAKYRKINS